MNSIILFSVFALYLLILLIIGVFSYRRGMGSAEDYFMAGRSFGTLVLFMSLFGTNVTAFALIGMPGLAYHAGVGVFGYFGAIGAFVTPLTFVLLGYPIWQLGKRHGYMTQAHMFGDRWQSEAISYLFFGLIILYTIPYLIIGLMGGGIAIEAISKGVVPYAVAAGFVAGVTVLYTSLGGMRGTAWTNVFQASIFLAFLMVAFFSISAKLGGMTALHQRLVAEALPLVGKQHPRLAPGIWATGFLVGPLSVIAFPHIFMRLMTARDAKALRKTTLIYPWGLILLYLPITLLGVWGALDIPGLVGQESDKILPLLVAKHLPVWLSAVGLAAILAAVMSSLDGQILTLSTMIAVDVFAHKSHKAIPLVGRVGVIVIAAIAFAIALLRPAGIFDVAVYAFSGYTLIVPIMAFGLFWKRSTKTGVITGMLLGHGLLAAYYLGFKFPTFGTFPVFPCIIIESLVVVLISFLTSPPPQDIVRRFDNPFGALPQQTR
ncbi:MAG: sodium:solute symporter family protein [Caldithrix sp.]|nr:MAG: sodium:solute symporter family protein [Caldithrix sp.]